MAGVFFLRIPNCKSETPTQKFDQRVFANCKPETLIQDLSKVSLISLKWFRTFLPFIEIKPSTPQTHHYYSNHLLEGSDYQFRSSPFLHTSRARRICTHETNYSGESSMSVSSTLHSETSIGVFPSGAVSTLPSGCKDKTFKVVELLALFPRSTLDDLFLYSDGEFSSPEQLERCLCITKKRGITTFKDITVTDTHGSDPCQDEPAEVRIYFLRADMAWVDPFNQRYIDFVGQLLGRDRDCCCGERLERVRRNVRNGRVCPYTSFYEPEGAPFDPNRCIRSKFFDVPAPDDYSFSKSSSADCHARDSEDSMLTTHSFTPSTIETTEQESSVSSHSHPSHKTGLYKEHEHQTKCSKCACFKGKARRSVFGLDEKQFYPISPPKPPGTFIPINCV